MKSKDILITIALLTLPSALIAWLRTIVDKDTSFFSNFLTFIVLSLIVFVVGSLLSERSKKK